MAEVCQDEGPSLMRMKLNEDIGVQLSCFTYIGIDA